MKKSDEYFKQVFYSQNEENIKKIAKDFLREISPRITKYIISVGGSKSDAKQIIHDTFFRVKRICSYKEITGSIINYCVGISRYIWKEELRRRNRYDILSSLNEDFIDKEYENDIEEDFLSEILKQEIQSLTPENYKIILNLYFYENLSHKEISEKLGISEANSRKWLQRAKAKLKKKIEKKILNKTK